jgi:hypothetical protein
MKDEGIAHLAKTQDLGQREIFAQDVHDNVIRKAMETVLLPPARRVLQEAR